MLPGPEQESEDGVTTTDKNYKHGPLGCHVDDLNPAYAEHYCSVCGATGTYSELSQIRCKPIVNKIKKICKRKETKNHTDEINSGFELTGGFFIILHIVQILHDKSVAGLSVFAITFYVIWGYWNIYYYSSIKQKWSLRATYFITVMNTIWLALLIYYTMKGI